METLKSIPKTTSDAAQSQSQNRAHLGALKQQPFARSQRYGHEAEMAHLHQWTPNQPEIRDAQDTFHDWSPDRADKPFGGHDKIHTPEVSDLRQPPEADLTC